MDTIHEKPESDLPQAETVEVESSEDGEDQKLKGLGGWLILVGIGVVVGPIRSFLQLVPLYMPIFSDGTFAELTTPNSDYYIPHIGTFIAAEIFCNTVIILASLYLIYLFFTRHYLFPKLYILIIGGSAIFIVIDAWVGSLFFPDEPFMDEDTIREFTRVMIGACIWIPYMLISKRVKLTFVEHRPGMVRADGRTARIDSN